MKTRVGEERLLLEEIELNHSLYVCNSWETLKPTTGFLFFSRTLTLCTPYICYQGMQRKRSLKSIYPPYVMLSY